VVVNAEKSTSGKIEISYIINNASWTTNYDIRIEDVDKPLNLIYKAKVIQNTGEDWNNVKLVLSTGNPSISNATPELNTYYLSFNNYYQSTTVTNKSFASTEIERTVQGKVTDYNGEALPGATVLIDGTGIGTVTDMDGYFSLNVPAGYSQLMVTFVGMNSQYVVANNSFLNVRMAQNNIEMEKYIVSSIASTELSGKTMGYSVSKAKKKEAIPIAIEKMQTTTEFEIKLPYTIPTDNKAYDVAMVEYEIPAEYDYTAVPKLSDNAYLVANITDWTELNLLDGAASLYFKGSYQGETYLDLKSFEDTLKLSIGRDQDIIIERKIQKDYSSKKLINTINKEEKAWEIQIKNNKDKAIKLTLEDQFPVSKNEEIKVELTESSGATIDAETGKLSWNISLAPKEKRSLIFKYSVKYPKNKKVVVE
jgi:hypothetical protein